MLCSSIHRQVMMPSPGNCAIKFLRSNLRRGAKPKVRIAVLGQASVGKTGEQSQSRDNTCGSCLTASAAYTT